MRFDIKKFLKKLPWSLLREAVGIGLAALVTFVGSRLSSFLVREEMALVFQAGLAQRLYFAGKNIFSAIKSKLTGKSPKAQIDGAAFNLSFAAFLFAAAPLAEAINISYLDYFIYSIIAGSGGLFVRNCMRYSCYRDRTVLDGGKEIGASTAVILTTVTQGAISPNLTASLYWIGAGPDGFLAHKRDDKSFVSFFTKNPASIVPTQVTLTVSVYLLTVLLDLPVGWWLDLFSIGGILVISGLAHAVLQNFFTSIVKNTSDSYEFSEELDEPASSEGLPNDENFNIT